MASKLDLFLELERRGVLPVKQTALLAELRKRKAIPPQQQPTPQQQPIPQKAVDFDVPPIGSGLQVSAKVPPLDTTRAISRPGRQPPTIKELQAGGQRVLERQKEITSQFARPALELGLTTKGAASGAAVGAAVGGPPGAVVGGVLGAGFGFATSQRAADLTDALLGQTPPALTSAKEQSTTKRVKQELIKTGKDIAVGVAAETGGLIVAKSLGFAMNLTGQIWHNTKGYARNAKNLFSDKTLKEKAGDILVANTKSGKIYAKNIEEAQQIQKEIPGLEFTRGQLSYDPEAITLEIALGEKNRIVKEKLITQRAEGAESIRQFIKKTFPENEGIVDTIVEVEAQKAGIAQAVKSRQELVELQRNILSQGVDPQVAGKITVERLTSFRQSAKGVAKQLYDEVPNAIIPVDDLHGDITSILKPFHRLEKTQKANFPEILNDFLKLFDKKKPDQVFISAIGQPINVPFVVKKKVLKFQDIRGIRSIMVTALRTLKSDAKPNAAAISRLGKAITAVEKSINQLEHVPGVAGDKYRKASTYYRTFSKTYKEGTVADVLRPGVRGEPNRVALVDVAGRFFSSGKLDAVDDFVRAAGNDAQALQAVGDFAAHDLLTGVVDPLTKEIVPSRFASWFSKNKSILQRFKLTDKFSNIQQAQQRVLEVLSVSDSFDKSVTSRLLGADIDKALPKMFTGQAGRNIGQTMTQLLDGLQGNAVAIKGLKKGYQKYLFAKARGAGVDILGNPNMDIVKLSRILEDHMPGIRVLYKKEPDKVKAFSTMLKAYQILGRNVKSPLGGQPDVAESIIQTISNIAAPFVTGRLSQLNSIKIITRNFTKLSQDQIEVFLTQAIFDPDFAETLIMMATGKKSGKFIQQRMNHHLATFGMLHISKDNIDNIRDDLGLDGIPQVGGSTK